MTMQLVGPYLTTTKYSSKQKKSKSQKLAKATAEHDKWLRDRGLHPEQRSLQHAHKGRFRHEIPDYDCGDSPHQLSNRVGNGLVRGMMANLHKESPQVQREIMEKASRCLPLYNKGGYQYATPDTDMTMVGSKSRRG